MVRGGCRDGPRRSGDRRSYHGDRADGVSRRAMKLLDGQRAIVTGGGSGIGRAAVRRMAAHGARVAILDRNAEAAEAVASDIGGVAFSVDVADAGAVDAAVRAATERLGGLSLLFNNAGIGGMARLHDYALDEWEQLIRVNLGGVY